MWYCRLYFSPVNFTWLSLRCICQRFLIKPWGMKIIQFCSIFISIGSMYFFYFKAQMLEVQKIFLLVKFFSQISCNKSLKTKISCFFLCFFCLTPLRLEYSQKDHFVPDITQAEEIQKPGSTELHEWSENIVNVESCQFLKGNCKFVSVISVK